MTHLTLDGRYLIVVVRYRVHPWPTLAVHLGVVLGVS